MSAQASEWSDLPNSSELFGGDFFGDELMDMYGGDPDPDMEARQHPGILVAMNAAAMDGGLSLGPSAEFVPMEAHSGGGPGGSSASGAPGAVVKGATQTTVTVSLQDAPAPAAPPRGAAVPVAVTSGGPTGPPPPKRAVPAGEPSAAQPSKKLRSATAPAAAVATRAASARSSKTAKIAATGGIKVGMQSSASAAAAAAANKKPVTRSSRMGRVVASVAGAQAASAVPGRTAPATAGPPTRSAAATVPKSKMPVGGGINHSVLARPSSSYSSSSAAAKKPAVTASSVVAGVKRASSEADFKDVASAAVSSLIQSASSASAKTSVAAGAATGSRTSSSSTKAPNGRAVDTSTAHISALTSQNWVAACNPIPTPAVTSSSSVSSAGENKEARTARRAALTQEERAKQNRDRNREHARNTRLRKKAYVEELKRTLTELVSQRDAADVERRHEAQRNREQREVRFRVMEEFLRLRGRNDPSSARWVAILEDNFVLTLPRTPFRETVVESASDYNLAEQVLRGAAPAMEDSKCVSSFLNSLVPAPAGAGDLPNVTVTYRVDRKHFFMDGAVAFMDYAASSVGLVRRGAPKEVAFKGSMRASFSPASNKLLSVDLKFDTGSVVQQVDEMSGGHDAAADAHDGGLGGADEADEILEALRVPNFDGADNGAGAVPVGAAKSTAQANVSESDESVRSTDGSSHA